MFTGIIEEIGRIRSIRRNGESIRIVVEASKVIDGTVVGDSMATNGVCLTVTDLDGNTFSADVMPETVRRSALKGLGVGDCVNLERALTPSTRMGGHIVMGHVDATGRIAAMRNDGNAVWITVETDSSVLGYMVAKGSIAIDGVSLTVVDVADGSFRVSVIPHTQGQTTLTGKRVGDEVNLESDILARYVEKLLGRGGGITLDFLKENGF